MVVEDSNSPLRQIGCLNFLLLSVFYALQSIVTKWFLVTENELRHFSSVGNGREGERGERGREEGRREEGKKTGGWVGGWMPGHIDGWINLYIPWKINHVCWITVSTQCRTIIRKSIWENMIETKTNHRYNTEKKNNKFERNGAQDSISPHGVSGLHHQNHSPPSSSIMRGVVAWIQCPPQSHMLQPWSLAEAGLQECRNPSLYPLSAAWLLWWAVSSSHLPSVMLSLPKALGPNDQGLKPGAKINPSFISWLSRVFLFTTMKSWQDSWTLIKIDLYVQNYPEGIISFSTVTFWSSAPL